MQKDQDGSYAEKSQFYHFVGWIQLFKNCPDLKLKYVVHYFVYKSEYVVTRGIFTLRGPQGAGSQGSQSAGASKNYWLGRFAPGPTGVPLLYPALFFL